MRRLRRIDPRIFDWVLALAFVFSATISTYTFDGRVGPAWLTALVASSSGSRLSSGATARSRRSCCGRPAS